MTPNLEKLAAHLRALEAVDFGAGKEWTPEADNAAAYLRLLRRQIEEQTKEPQS
jgi:hypothetical protein